MNHLSLLDLLFIDGVHLAPIRSPMSFSMYVLLMKPKASNIFLRDAFG